MNALPLHPPLSISPEVQAALNAGRPVVALESTIISHGMPYPQNRATALQVEACVRESGAVPATIAIMDGQLKAGLTEGEIERLALAGQTVTKVSRRDMAVVLANKTLGATTVASTMLIAHMAGIRVFATGGIGGVHRGAEKSMDISADLQELARTPVTVVCAGAKSILDLGLTLEYLETHGVPVLGFQTDTLPAFFTRESDFTLPHRVESAADIAAIMRAQRSLGLSAGMVVANPIPAHAAMPKAAIDAAIHTAVQEAAAQGISGKASTPFLLQRVNELTGGGSLESNIALVLNNAQLAADIACALAA